VIRFISGQPNEGMVQMIVIGADTHKATHTFAAVQERTGRIVSTRTIRADAEGMLAAWQRGAPAGQVG